MFQSYVPQMRKIFPEAPRSVVGNAAHSSFKRASSVGKFISRELTDGQRHISLCLVCFLNEIYRDEVVIKLGVHRFGG